MLTGALWVEEDDTTVVQVEGDCNSVHSKDFFPNLCMLADVIYYQQRMIIASLTDCLEVGIGGSDDEVRGER